MQLNSIQLSPFVRSLERQDDIILYHSLIGGGCAVTPPIYNVLKSLSEKKLFSDVARQFSEMGEDEIADIIETFTGKGFILTEENCETEYDAWQSQTNKLMETLPEGKRISSVQLIVSNNCNFNCEYCFVNSIYVSPEREHWQKAIDNRIMTEKQAFAYINNVIEYIKKQDNPSLHIQFFGGEPLTNKPVILSVLDHFQFGEKFGVPLQYSIVTNGSLIDEDIAGYFSKYNVSVSVSFDNPDESVRKDKNGEDNRGKILHNLEILQRHQVHTTFNSVLSKETFPYFDYRIVDCAVKYGISEVGVLFDLDPAFYEKVPLEIIADKLFNLYIYGKEKNVSVTGYWRMLYASIFQYNAYQKGFKTCVATGSQLSIEPSGAIFACKGSSGYFGMAQDLPSLFSSPTYQTYSNRTLMNSPACKGCEYEAFCSGYCLGPLEKKFGNIHDMEKLYCALTKTLMKKLLLQEENLEKYWI